MKARSSGRASAVRSASPSDREKARHRHGVPAFFAVRGTDCARRTSRCRWTMARRSPPISAKARDLSKAYGLPLDPEAMVGDLSVGERQRIEIIRCLLQQPDLIILDEPTSVLTPQEADKLFVTLERLRDEGKSILYISHRLEEVKRLCDGATVMRHGKVVGRCDPRKETAASLARMMVGADVKLAESTPISLEGAQELLGRLRAEPQAGGTVFDAAEEHLAERSRRRGAWHRRCCGQRAGRIVRSAVGRGLAGKRRCRAHSRKVGRADGYFGAAQARRGLRSRGAARPWRGSTHAPLGKPASVALRHGLVCISSLWTHRRCA